ncbi:hypothetical protein Q4E93_25455 [Flavitalea sp. BT771]|uniref:hypothetical protein n=1 Tax=Flavitalea sp. BT771 TaxID=3063329 RepID=UPI0026E46A49|nr:hypothetical protein [Flavitalea sp. BT771]MDO6433980.1 hypothetical protein [Flavitalea sp. BT771]MDV6222880.1 hypothetical protein [Flavitalea sp. BT771]
MRKLVYIQLLFILIANNVFAQKKGDTTAMIREFNQVMAFAVQPYLHYSSLISLRSGPMMDTTKTGNVLHNEFYKVQDDLYYGNEQEEIFLQDSLMVRISHSRKMIQMNKVDMATKKKIDILPLKNTDVQRMLRERCTVSRLPDAGDTGQIIIRTNERRTPQGFANSEMVLIYHRGSHLPLLMEVSMHMRNEATEQMGDMFKANGFNVAKMETEKDGRKNLEITQTVSVSFREIEVAKDKAGQMPLWRDRVNYDAKSNNYSGRARCEGYEVIKTF